jgi:hypothetical protein
MSERECPQRERGLGPRLKREAFSVGPATRAGRREPATGGLTEERAE